MMCEKARILKLLRKNVTGKEKMVEESHAEKPQQSES